MSGSLIEKKNSVLSVTENVPPLHSKPISVGLEKQTDRSSISGLFAGLGPCKAGLMDLQ